MFAEVITIGDEILIGQVVDSNSAWMAESLNSVGIRLRQITSVSDRSEEITRTLEEAFGRVSLVFMTGGLGPTNDDITRNTLADHFGSSLSLNEEALGRIEKFLASRGVRMNELNRQQAMLPDRCELIPNRFGTATGMWFTRKDQHCISLPGVPYEMKGMMSEFILPELRKRFSLPVVEHWTILTQGCPESALAEQLATFEQKLRGNSDLSLAYLPSPGQVRLRLSCTGSGRQAVRDKLENAAASIRKIIPDYIVSYDDQKIEMAVGRLLADEQKSLSTAESCTGGMIAERIVSVPGASDYFLGAVVAYSNEIKARVLGVGKKLIEKHGAVSREVAESMARNAREMFRSDYAIATSGIAGPDGGTEEKPVGTAWIAVASGNSVISELFSFGDVRERNIDKTAITALNMLRKKVISEK